MVDFREQLRPASFRGIPFHLMDDNTQGGRNIITHEIPGRDEPIHEDLGELPRIFQITAIIIGGEFVLDAESFEAALLKRGPATLTHPHYGDVQVVVKTYHRQHSIGAVGEVVFTVTLERHGMAAGTTAVSDSARKLSSAGNSLFEQARASFKERLFDAGVPDYVLADGVTRLNSFIRTARTVLQHGGAGSFSHYPVFHELTGGVSDQIVRLFRDITALVKPSLPPVVGNFAATPAVLPASNLARSMVSVAGNNVDSPSPLNNPSRLALRNNARAITDLFQQCALAAAAECCRYAEYDSKQEAIALRGDMSNALSRSAYRVQTAGRIEDSRAIIDVLAAVTEDINERLGRLPRTVKVRPATVQPSLALANRLYGDNPANLFARAQDIAIRNHIAHPGFVGVKPLEVLVND